MKKIDRKKFIRRTTSVLFWIILWQIASTLISSDILVASPTSVAKIFFELLCKIEFWQTVKFSLIRIISGFFMAVILGTILATIASCSKLIKEILYIPMTIIKATPVASFIIIALIWLNSGTLSIFVSFLMVVPIIYTNTLRGIENIDIKLLEMMKVFHVSLIKKVRYLYIPSVIPFFTSAINVSLGMCWKAGIAGEVIGIPTGSIGEKLYQAKIFLNTGEVFAWTIVIILISMIFEKVFMVFLKFIERCLLGDEFSGT